MDGLADTHHEGAWVIIASALNNQTRMSLQFRMEKCAMMIRISDTWYSTDIFAERVPGPFLIDDFQPILQLLEDWRFDEND